MCQVWAKKQQRCALTLKCALLSALTTPFNPASALYPTQLFLLHLVVFVLPRRRVALRRVAGIVAAHFAWAQQLFQGPVPIAMRLPSSPACQHTAGGGASVVFSTLLLVCCLLSVLVFALTSTSPSQSISSDLLPA